MNIAVAKTPLGQGLTRESGKVDQKSWESTQALFSDFGHRDTIFEWKILNSVRLTQTNFR
jgi:hypothetical protein